MLGGTCIAEETGGLVLYFEYDQANNLTIEKKLDYRQRSSLQ
jgi:hypothetical protein